MVSVHSCTNIFRYVLFVYMFLLQIGQRWWRWWSRWVQGGRWHRAKWRHPRGQRQALLLVRRWRGSWSLLVLDTWFVDPFCILCCPSVSRESSFWHKLGLWVNITDPRDVGRFYQIFLLKIAFTCFNHPIFPIWGWLPFGLWFEDAKTPKTPKLVTLESAMSMVSRPAKRSASGFHPWDSPPKRIKMVDFRPVIGDEKPAGCWSTRFLDKLGICCTFYAYLGLWMN